MATLAAVDELSGLLNEIDMIAQRDLVLLWRAVHQRDPEFIREALVQGVPEVVAVHSQIAADLTAQWYDDLDTTSAFQALPAAPPEPERVAGTAEWAANALFRPGAATPLDLLSGAVQRLVFNTSRETVTANAGRERVRWARITRGDAKVCEWCMMLASRGYVYGSEAQARKVGAAGLRRKYDHKGRSWASRGLPEATVQRGRMDRAVQSLGEKFHDNCRCRAAPNRGGDELPDVTAEYERRYREAVQATDTGGPIDLKKVMAYMKANP